MPLSRIDGSAAAAVITVGIDLQFIPAPVCGKKPRIAPSERTGPGRRCGSGGVACEMKWDGTESNRHSLSAAGLQPAGLARAHAAPDVCRDVKRKAEDSNPKPLSSTRFRDGGRPIGELHLPVVWPIPRPGIEPGPPAREAGVLPFDQRGGFKRKAVVTIHRPRGPIRLATGAAADPPFTFHVQDRGGDRTRVDGVAARRLCRSATRPEEERMDAD